MSNKGAHYGRITSSQGFKPLPFGNEPDPPPPPIKFVLSLCSPPNPSNHHNALSIQDGSWQEAQHSSGNFAQETGLSSTGVRFKTEFNLLRFTKCVDHGWHSPHWYKWAILRRLFSTLYIFPPYKKRTLHNSPNPSSLSWEHSCVLSDTHTLDISKQTGSLFQAVCITVTMTTAREQSTKTATQGRKDRDREASARQRRRETDREGERDRTHVYMQVCQLRLWGISLSNPKICFLYLLLSDSHCVFLEIQYQAWSFNLHIKMLPRGSAVLLMVHRTED